MFVHNIHLRVNSSMLCVVVGWAECEKESLVHCGGECVGVFREDPPFNSCVISPGGGVHFTRK